MNQNDFAGQLGRYLDALGDWRTYRDLERPEQLPHRLAHLAAAYFGLKGLAEGRPGPTGLLAAILAVHALEQVTGGLATAAIRLYDRAEPVARYRGIAVRQSPFTPPATRLLGRLSGGRLLAAGGLYFSQAGRTWHAQSLTWQVYGAPRTWSRVGSLGLPARAFFFDRPIRLPEEREPQTDTVPVQRLVELVRGEQEAENLPGFIGAINELEGLTPLQGAKLLLFVAHWLLVDPAERDEGLPEVDYPTLARKGPGSTGQGGGGNPAPPGLFDGPRGGGWPSTRRAAPEYCRDRIRLGGQSYPLLVKRVVTPLINGGPRRAEAFYHDGHHWREITDEATRIRLAQAVEAGLVSVAEPGRFDAPGY